MLRACVVLGPIISSVRALASRALPCTAAQTPPPPDECRAPWPADESWPDAGQISITFKSQMSSGFAVRRILLELDDTAVRWHMAPANGPFLEDGSIPVLSSPALVGKHILKVLVQLDGLEVLHIRGYRFEVRSSHAIHIEPGSLSISP